MMMIGIIVTDNMTYIQHNNEYKIYDIKGDKQNGEERKRKETPCEG